MLAQAPDLRVVARTSSFSFKGKDVDIPEIARRLKVATCSKAACASRARRAHHRAARSSLG